MFKQFSRLSDDRWFLGSVKTQTMAQLFISERSSFFTYTRQNLSLSSSFIHWVLLNKIPGCTGSTDRLLQRPPWQWVMAELYWGGDEAELGLFRRKGKCFCTENEKGVDAFLWAQDCMFRSSTESWQVAKVVKSKVFSSPLSCPATDFSLWYSHTLQVPFFGKMPPLLPP